MNPQLDYSTKKISRLLMLEIKRALKDVSSYGSIEVYVQDSVVTQITVRNIKKTSNGLSRRNRRASTTSESSSK